jgi:hypothetical protein
VGAPLLYKPDCCVELFSPPMTNFLSAMYDHEKMISFVVPVHVQG